MAAAPLAVNYLFSGITAGRGVVAARMLQIRELDGALWSVAARLK